MTLAQQPHLFDDDAMTKQVVELVVALLKGYSQPSAWELLEKVDGELGPKSRWVVKCALGRLRDSDVLTDTNRNYVGDLLDSDDLDEALRGTVPPGREIQTGFEALLRASSAYHGSAPFQDMISFMANFRDYAPFNNMLVKIQNPGCGFYATAKDWDERFGRMLKEDARPLLILAPMHPVMLVYDVDQTEGEALPEHLTRFAKFEGEWDTKRYDRAVSNAMTRDQIRVDVKTLSSTHGGFATTSRRHADCKVRIGIHDGLDVASRYGVLCHELAHIYLGHLDGDADGWWPSRSNLPLRVIEIEAEATAYIVTQRAGLSGTSATYVSGYLKGGDVPAGVSLDLIAKAAKRIEDMSTRAMTARKPKRGGAST